MIILIAVDDNGGMLFNNRRQSQDRNLRLKILELREKATLWMNEFSSRQFPDLDQILNLNVDENFLDKAKPGDYCFVENLSILPYINEIEQIFLFKWNRVYPNDFSLDLGIFSSGWILKGREEFKGFSHEKITMEVYSNENY